MVVMPRTCGTVRITIKKIYVYINTYIYPKRRKPIQDRSLVDFLAKICSGFAGPIEET